MWTRDLYNAKQRSHFAAQASAETGVDERALKPTWAVC